MLPLTCLARFRARARRCARSAPGKWLNREKWTSKQNQRARVALEMTCSPGSISPIFFNEIKRVDLTSDTPVGSDRAYTLMMMNYSCEPPPC